MAKSIYKALKAMKELGPKDITAEMLKEYGKPGSSEAKNRAAIVRFHKLAQDSTEAEFNAVLKKEDAPAPGGAAKAKKLSPKEMKALKGGAAKSVSNASKAKAWKYRCWP